MEKSQKKKSPGATRFLQPSAAALAAAEMANAAGEGYVVRAPIPGLGLKGQEVKKRLNSVLTTDVC